MAVVVGAGEMAQWLRAVVAFSRGPRYYSQYPHDVSQPSVTLVLGAPITFSGLCRNLACKWYIDININTGKASLHIKGKREREKRERDTVEIFDLAVFIPELWGFRFQVTLLWIRGGPLPEAHVNLQ